jgi:hypothetical protein
MENIYLVEKPGEGWVAVNAEDAIQIMSLRFGKAPSDYSERDGKLYFLDLWLHERINGQVPDRIIEGWRK